MAQSEFSKSEQEDFVRQVNALVEHPEAVAERTKISLYLQSQAWDGEMTKDEAIAKGYEADSSQYEADADAWASSLTGDEYKVDENAKDESLKEYSENVAAVNGGNTTEVSDDVATPVQKITQAMTAANDEETVTAETKSAEVGQVTDDAGTNTKDIIGNALKGFLSGTPIDKFNKISTAGVQMLIGTLIGSGITGSKLKGVVCGAVSTVALQGIGFNSWEPLAKGATQLVASITGQNTAQAAEVKDVIGVSQDDADFEAGKAAAEEAFINEDGTSKLTAEDASEIFKKYVDSDEYKGSALKDVKKLKEAISEGEKQIITWSKDDGGELSAEHKAAVADYYENLTSIVEKNSQEPNILALDPRYALIPLSITTTQGNTVLESLKKMNELYDFETDATKNKLLSHKIKGVDIAKTTGFEKTGSPEATNTKSEDTSKHDERVEQAEAVSNDIQGENSAEKTEDLQAE